MKLKAKILSLAVAPLLLAIAVIGALCVSVLLSLIATPTVYYLMRHRGDSTQ